jgi:hypothetical protein
MTRGIRISFALLTIGCAAAAHAETGYFVVRLGQDTTAVERYDRTANRLEIHQVGRTPRVLERRYVHEYAGGKLTRFSMVATAPGAEKPVQTVEATFASDSARATFTNAEGQVQKVAVAWPAGDVVSFASTSPWAVYEDAVMKFVKSKADSARSAAYFVGANAAPNPLVLRRVGRDSVVIDNLNARDDRFRARIDAQGRLLAVRPVAGTLQLSAERVEKLDLPALAASFTAREKAGGGMGTLSPRDTVTATAGGASLWLDYSRPAKRGRAIFGSLVPYGQVWRTGANAATQFRTDQPLAFGDVVVPAGTYTLWSIPNADGWTLIVNEETGISGTARKPEKDLYRIPLAVSTLAEPAERFTIGVDPTAEGGVLRLEWDTTRAAAPFTVRK